MISRFTASHDWFVLHISREPDPGPIRQQARTLGVIDEVPGHEELLLLRLNGPPEDRREAWEGVREALGPGVEVDPVFVDDEGHPHLPTGRVTIRFLETPSDSDLERLASEHGLRLCRRNKSVPMQASFERARRVEKYLPDLLEEIGTRPDVTAWPDTLARFRRI